MNEKNQFYFQGRMFDSYEQFMEFAKVWPSLELTQEAAERILDFQKKDIIMNIFLMGRVLTNDEFTKVVEHGFYEMVKKIQRINQC